MRSRLLTLFVTLVVRTTISNAGEAVTYLPGYGELNFTLETGYVGVGEDEDVQLFYYFVESQGTPSEDPLMLWTTAGPGCSTLSGFLLENGPLQVDILNYNSGLPTLLTNPNTWAQSMSVIYLDGASGTVYSYSKSTGIYYSSDRLYAEQIFEFLLKWFDQHPQYLDRPFYIGGNGGDGKVLPLVVQYILTGAPSLNLKGYVLGNPGTSNSIDFNAHVEIYHRLALIPDYLYQSAYENCNGNFTSVDNPECAADLAAIGELIKYIPQANSLKPACNAELPSSADVNGARRSLQETSKVPSILQADIIKKECDAYIYMILNNWANDTEVQQALHVVAWTQPEDCSDSTYNKTIDSVVDYHQSFTTSDLQVLIFSGDHDIAISYISTLQWIRNLSVSQDEYWTTWFVDNEVAGYKMKFTNDGNYNLTFTTIKGAGHFAAADKVRETSVMVKKWIATGTF